MARKKAISNPYFEVNLPREIPLYYKPELRQKMKECVERVYARSDKLNAACEKLFTTKGLRRATFHALAKKVFDMVSAERFDTMTPSELASAAYLLYDGTEYLDRIEWPNATVLYDTAFVSTKDWEALRHFGIGGSDSSVVMGISHYQTKRGIVYEKLGYPELVSDPGKQAIFDRGHYVEQAVIDTFCAKTGAVQIHESRMFASKRHPYSTANLDGVLRMPSGKLAIFEAKSAIDVWAKIVQWKGTNIPANYVTQIHQYMAVMDDDRIDGVYIGMLPVTDHTICDVYIGSEYDPTKYFHHFEERDRDFEEEILMAEEQLWTDYVMTGILPEESKDAGLDAEVRKRFEPTPLSDPNIPEQKIHLAEVEETFEEMAKAEAQMAELKKQAERWENYRNLLRNAIIGKMNGAQKAVVTDETGEPKFEVKNTLITKKGVDMELLETFHPDVFEEVKKSTTFTKFSYKEVKPKPSKSRAK